MSKVTINGTSGITAYESDNTTVAVTKTPAQLVADKPTVFTSASPFIISGGVSIDTTGDPAVLRYSDGTSTNLSTPAATYITKSTESFSGSDQTHFMPSGIQSGDLLIMVQAAGLKTTDGYALPTGGFGTGFTNVNSNDSVDYWYWRPGGSQYDISHHKISYKIAAGTESQTNISGFASVSSPHGTVRGHRTLYVYRPPFSLASVTHSFTSVNTGRDAASSYSSHQQSTSVSGSSTKPTIGIVQYAAGNTNKTASISGAVTSFDATTINNSGNALSSIFTGAFSSTHPTGSITATGPSGQTTGDCLTILTFTLND